ncbi:unnamed protein product [Clavelina lepadiformis]|uniref:Uncharacterized protein n=1 Tax=Clavelina lepadiformis TaxID=159417 RepID=A0ABP0H255_CLALP
MVVVDSTERKQWRNTPRPTSRMNFFEVLSADDNESSRRSDRIWQPIPSGLKHRFTTISGWVCVPRSVVMATTLNEKHENLIEQGQLSTLAEVVNRNKKKLEGVRQKNVHRKKYNCQKPSSKTTNSKYDKEKLFKKVIWRSNESEDEVKPSQRQTPKSLKHQRNITEGLLSSPRRFQEENLEDGHNVHLKPVEQDLYLQSQCKKATQVTLYLPEPAKTPPTSNARKLLNKRSNTSDNDNERCKKLPGYSKRNVRNCRSPDHIAMSRNRPVMTTCTSWFPLSFHDKEKGKLVQLSCDFYGYQSMAEYTELCRSLEDGMAVLEQPIEVGDCIRVKVAEADRRRSLLYVAVSSFDDKKSDLNTSNALPCTRVSCHVMGVPVGDWEFSNEIKRIRENDELLFTVDALGRLKYHKNGEDALVLLQLYDGNPHHFALCLGLGVTKIQLLGGRKKCPDLLNPQNSYKLIPYATQHPIA